MATDYTNLDRENSVEVLRALVKKQQEHMDYIHGELEKALDEKAKQAQTSFKLNDQLVVLRKIIFGKSSEKRNQVADRERDQDEMDLLVHSRALLPRPKNKQTRELEEDVQIHEMTDRELEEESRVRGLRDPRAEQWQAMPGFYDQLVEITIIERRYKKIKHRRQKYTLKNEFMPKDQQQESVIIAAPGPEKILPGSHYSVDFATSVVADKYISHIPLERQTRQMESLGLKDMSTKTLYNLCAAVSVHLEPMAERIKSEVLFSSLCVHADETPWPIQVKEQDSGYMWVISNQAGSYYRFEPTRSGKVVDEIFRGYKGPVMADGYTGYTRLSKVEGIELANCWAHVRRRFFDIQENYPTECNEILDLIDKLFNVERRAQSFDALKRLRQEESKKIAREISHWLMKMKQEARSESGLMQAIDYNLRYWTGLTRFLKDVRIPLSNNEAERTIRHAVMGRKNFYGSRTHNGADVAATLYTIIESCKKVELDPRQFINMAVHMSARGGNPATPLEHARKTRAQ